MLSSLYAGGASAFVPAAPPLEATAVLSDAFAAWKDGDEAAVGEMS